MYSLHIKVSICIYIISYLMEGFGAASVFVFVNDVPYNFSSVVFYFSGKLGNI